MLNKKVQEHFDALERLEESLEKEIDVLLNAIDIKKLVDNSTAELTQVGATVRLLIKTKYSERAIKLGIELAQGTRESNDKGKD